METGFVIISYVATFGGIGVLGRGRCSGGRARSPSDCRRKTDRGPEPSPDHDPRCAAPAAATQLAAPLRC